MCLMAAIVPHWPNKYFHVTASNGIVSNSPYTPLAVMTASPIASVQVFETVRDADVVSLRSVRSQDAPSIHPLLAVRPEGANHLWRKNPPRELSIDLVADERLGRVTGRAGAS
jgi:hypothetical protein